MKKFVVMMIVLAPALVLASGAEHGGGHHIEVPTKDVFWQVFNLTVMFGGLFYFLKDSVVASFRAKKDQYLEASKKSATAKQEAEKSFLDVKHKLEQLQTAQDENIARANAEAADMRNSMIAEANALAKRIKEDADQTIKLELARAEKQLKEKLIKDSVEAARLVLVKDVAQADQSKLQTEFVNHI